MKSTPQKNYIEYFKSPKWPYIIWPYLALLLIHLVFVSQAQQPWFFPDEFIQLGHARYFAGGDHFLLLGGHPYSHFAYAFLIMPAFWLSSDPNAIYKIIAVINAIFASALYFPIYYILRNLFSLNKKTVAIITFTTCLYPAFVAQSMIAWQDAVIFTFYAAAIALLLYFLKKKTYLSAILFPSTVGFLYMMHVRALPVLILTILFLLFIAIYRRELRRKILFALGVMVVFFIVTKLVNSHIIDVIWQGDIMPYSISDMFRRVATLTGVKIFLTRTLGQLLYLIQATYGLFFLGFIYLLQYIWKNKKNTLKKTLENDNILTLSYLLLTSLGVFFTSALFNAVPLHMLRPDQLIYGRYNELFLAPFLALGLLSFYFKTNKRWYYLIITLLVFAASFVLRSEANVTTELVPLMIPGITLWLFLFEGFKVLIISAIVLFFLLIFVRLFAKKFIYGIFVMFILFGINISVFYFAYSNLNAGYLSTINLLKTLKTLDSGDLYYVENSFCKYVDPNLSKWLINYNKYSYQWLLPSTRFHAFDEQAENNPEYEYVVATTCWEVPNSMQVEVDNYNIQAIWKIKNK